MTQFVVVGGTDTGVGKTFVTAALARALIATGRRVVAIKPVESGCDEGPRDEEDGARLAAATGQAAPREALVRLRAPIAPALAAEREGVTVDIDALTATIRELGAPADLVLVEGAGGLLSPLSWTGDIMHIASGLEARVLLVGADRLGTLHHVRAAALVMVDRWLLPAGVVLSAPASADASTGSNAGALARLLRPCGEIAAHVACVPRTDAAGAAGSLEPVARWLTQG